MPITYAPTRKNRGSTTIRRETKYERVPPSRLRFIPLQKAVKLGTMLLTHYYHLFAFAIFHLIRHKKILKVDSDNTTSVYIPWLHAEMLPFSFPNVAVCLKRNERSPPTDVMDMINRYSSGEATRIVKDRKSFMVYLCTQIPSSDIPSFLALKQYTDPSYIGSSGYITPHNIENTMLIISLATTASLVFRYGPNPDTSSPALYGCYQTLVMSQETAKVTAFISENSYDDPIEEKEFDYKVDCVGAPIVRYIPTRNDEVPTLSPYSSVSAYTGTRGIAATYNKDVSMPDPDIFMNFARAFPKLFDTTQYDENALPLPDCIRALQRTWKTELMSTDLGEALGHLMLTLLIAHETGASVCPIFTGSRYEGCILGGSEWSIMVDDQIFGPQTSDLFAEELLSLNRHEVTLKKILGIVKVDVPLESIKTLRGLRALVNPARIDAMDQNKVSELLPDLSFDTRPELVNPTTLKSALQLLTSSDDPVVPTPRFMPDEAFWSTDKYVKVLSMFGRRVPTFSTGTELRKVTQVVRGDGSDKAKPYDSKPPTFLQVFRVPLVTAASHWKNLLSTGLVRGEFSIELPGSINFRAQAKSEIWVALNKYVADGVGAEVSNLDSNKRPREDESGSVSTPGTLPVQESKKRRGFGFF